MELRKRTLNVWEMVEAEEDLACEYCIWSLRKQTAAKGQMSRARKGV